jgi:hypothetical protein
MSLHEGYSLPTSKSDAKKSESRLFRHEFGDRYSPADVIVKSGRSRQVYDCECYLRRFHFHRTD